MQSANRNMIVALLGGALLLVVVLTIIFYHPKSTNTRSTQRYDANSGETISDPKGKTPDTYGVDPNIPTYLGFSKLLDYGLTSDQLANLKATFETYTKPQKIEQISVTVNEINFNLHHTNDPNSVDTIMFPVVFNGKTKVKATVKLPDSINLQLILSNNTDDQLFDSGSVGPGDDV